jgi:hypothetical protein
MVASAVLLAARVGHDQVQDGEIDLLAFRLEEIDCPGAVSRRSDRIAPPFNHSLVGHSQPGLGNRREYVADLFNMGRATL